MKNISNQQETVDSGSNRDDNGLSDKKNRRRRRKHIRTVFTLATLCILLLVSISALAFAASVIFENRAVFPEQIAQVFYLADVPVIANEPVPGWLGEVPGGDPAIGTDVYHQEYPAIPDPEIFSNVPFYIADKVQYYIEFYGQNPDMDLDTVVWKVNAFLHVPKFSYIRVNEDPVPLLVNPSHRLPYGFSPAVLVPVYQGNPEMLGTPETAEAFRLLRVSANRAGFDLAVVSAYRNAERQRYLWERQGSTDGVVARPYHSEHQTGRALDLWGPGPSGLLDAHNDTPSPTGQWVRDNVHDYGFIVRYTEENTHITGFISEPWHITYVTLEVSQYIYQNNLSSLEEFVARNPEFRIGG